MTKAKEVKPPKTVLLRVSSGKPVPVIHVNKLDGFAGQSAPIGSVTMPSNNYEDATILAEKAGAMFFLETSRAWPCPICGEFPLIDRTGDKIHIKCCVQLDLVKKDHLTEAEAALGIDKKTAMYPPHLERKLLALALETWNTRND